MAISPIPHSKRPSSSSKSNVKNISTWEIKRKLAQQRLKGLDSKGNNGEAVDTDMAIVCFPPSSSPANDIQITSVVVSSAEEVSSNLPPSFPPSSSPADDIQITSVVVSTSPLERAEDIRAKLPPQFPTFVKSMLKSHVSGGFWLGLPSKFCVAYLPKSDETIVLVDENGEEHYTKYLAAKGGLSGGWRGFSIAHDLRDKDVLVFQLIEPCKFKVYIVRKRDFDGATSLVTEPEKMDDQPEEEEAHNPLQLVPAEHLVSDQSGDESDISASQIMDGIRFSDSPISFIDVNSFEDFNVHVDGLIIDSEIPFHLRSKYYELCRSQRIFLHENLMPGINTKLAAGMISETINIADAVRVAKPSADPQNLESWDRTLKAFEDLGMAVGFLRDRIQKLLRLGRESRAVIERKRRERGEAEEEMRCLRMKLSEVEKRVAEIDALEVKNGEFEAVFLEVSGALW